MSYRIQIDVYGDRDKNKEQTEKEEKKNDKKFWIIALAFLFIGFVLFSREMFTRVLLDRETPVSTLKQDGITTYDLRTQRITVTGQKDQEESASITIAGMDGTQIADYKLFFSIPSDWEHSLVTVVDRKGVEVYTEQYNGFSRAKALSSKKDASLAVNNFYGTLISLVFGKGTRLRGNMLLYAIVWLLMIAEVLSFQLWKWVFLKYRIKWAMNREEHPSSTYKLFIVLARFALFILILLLSVLSYGI